jgi:hypothetical protein
MTKIEKMIWNAVVAVEGMPADPRLCEARNLLSQARELVGDFMDASAAEQRGEKGTAKP